MQLVVILRGIPGSGKTTAAGHLNMIRFSRGNSTMSVCSADNYFLNDGVYKFDPVKIKLAHEDCYKRFDLALRSGESVIVDNTNTRIWEMQKYINRANECGARVTVYRMDTDLETCLRRQTHGVPRDKVIQMHERFEDYPGEFLIKG